MKKPASFEVTPEMVRAIYGAQRLLSHIATDGDSSLERDIADQIVKAKYRLIADCWGPDAESEFLFNYDLLAKLAYPVTLESLDAILPEQTEGDSEDKRLKTKAEMTVRNYRRITFYSLIMLVFLQAYWLCGAELRGNLIKLQSGYYELVAQPEKLENKSFLELHILEQEIIANYQVLKRWNLFYVPDEQDSTSYFAISADPKTEVPAGFILEQLNTSFYSHLVAANFVLNTFQSYLLPLLYGLFGALIFVLRGLLNEIRMLTYTRHTELRYRLRLILGALAGMIIGWFFKPDEAEALASLSPMAMAFLMGYNVDVLFSMMDKVVDSIRRQTVQQGGPTSIPSVAKDNTRE
ncbi:hypothetical protein [Photobacterium lipolyticum]|uniref:Uncharacterized protein n=1 Tax=Photobacterium lipolyticum TaxID=266810 RepID=A0A2T3MUQ9_9GAMM|nr:hypothetical protein [Photobacterium lipolyticum]PSW03699.1 hypothetical protein C9I89_16315 [Photobacterium lipolyticum]